MATLYDHMGRPVTPGKLKREQVTDSIMQVRNPYDPQVTSGLTPQRLQDLLSRARNGDHEDYLTLAREMEQRDPHYYSVLQTRKLAIFSLPFQVDPASESSEDQAIADEVLGFIDTAMFKLAILDSLDSLGKGFSCLEIMWDTSESQWTPADLVYRNPRFFKYDQEHGRELRVVDGSSEGEALLPYKYVVHTPKLISGLSLAGGLARIVAALHMFKGYAIKSWMAFAEVFGMPIRMGKFNHGASEDEIEALRRAVRDIGHDAACVIPDTMMIEFVRANASGNAGSDEFYLKLADWLNKGTSKAVLGQTMTTEDGSSLAQASIHNEVRIDIRNADALQFANAINRDLIRPFVDLNYGPRRSLREYPQFSIQTEEPEDLTELATALIPFIDRGLPVMAKTILEKFGLPEPEAEAQMLAAVGGGSEDGEDGDDESASNELRALKTWLDRESKTNTNMRAFRKMLAERLSA